MEKNNQSVDIKSLSKEQRAALMAQLQQEEKEDRIARRETYEALRGEFMHEVKTNVLEMVNAVTGFRGWLEKSRCLYQGDEGIRPGEKRRTAQLHHYGR